MPSTPTEAKTLNLTALIERLEKADGPSRELDALIWCVEHPEAKFLNAYRAYDQDALTQVEFTLPPKRTAMVTGRYYPHAANVTASIDAAVSLATRLLPGRPVIMGWRQTSETRPWARVGLWADPDATGATPAIALCLATLRALSEQEGSK